MFVRTEKIVHRFSSEPQRQCTDFRPNRKHSARKQISPTADRIFADINFPTKKFADQKFLPTKIYCQPFFCPPKFLPIEIADRIFADRNFRRSKFSPIEIFADLCFGRKNQCEMRVVSCTVTMSGAQLPTLHSIAAFFQLHLRL